MSATASALCLWSVVTYGFLFLSKTKKPLKDKSASEQRDTIRSQDELGNELLMAEVNHPPKDSDKQGEEISQGTTRKRGETIHTNSKGKRVLHARSRTQERPERRRQNVQEKPP